MGCGKQGIDQHKPVTTGAPSRGSGNASRAAASAVCRKKKKLQRHAEPEHRNASAIM